MLGTRRQGDLWLPGRNASTPIRSTTTPPLIFFTSVPDTASSFSWLRGSAPDPHEVGLLLREDDRAFLILEMLEEHLDHVPFFERARVLELVDRHGAFRLEADVEDDGGVGHAQYLSI